MVPLHLLRFCHVIIYVWGRRWYDAIVVLDAFMLAHEIAYQQKLPEHVCI